MGSMNVYDDGSQSWGSIGSGIASSIMGAPQKAAAFTHTIETIKAMRAKAEQDKAQWDATLGAVNNVDAATLPAAVAPRAYTAADISTPAVLDAPLSVTDRTTGIRGGADVPNGMFTDPRELAKAEADRRLAVAGQKAAIMADPKQWAQQTALGNVASAGVPTDPYERAKLDFLAGKGMPTHIGVDESKNPVKNWVPVNEKGEPIGQMVSSTIKPPGNYVLSSPVSGVQTSSLKSPAEAREALARIENDRIANGGLKTPVEAMEAARLFEVAYPRSRVEVDESGRKVTKSVRAEPIPDWLKQLHKLSDDVAQGRHNAPEGTPQQPYVDPNADQVISKGPAQAAELRKEYQNTQAVSDWIVTAPLFNSAIKSAQEPTNQGDINIMYAFAKLMDPGSVVRDQEGKLVMNSGTIPESIVGTFNRLVTGGGTMDPQVRLNLIDTLKNRMDEIRASKDVTDKFYREQVAPAAGLNPNEVLIPLVEPLVYDRNTILRGGPDPAAAAAQTRQTTPEDVQAREWATQNPNDPRAQAILRRLGGQP
jgi:hypothetical protein